MNSKGYKELPHYVRVMQGDGISYETFEGILKTIKESGWSLDNMAFGSGGEAQCCYCKVSAPSVSRLAENV